MATLNELLTSLDLAKFIDIFKAQDISDLKTARKLTERDLKELGLSVGARKKLIEALTRDLVPTTPAGKSAVLERTFVAVKPDGVQRGLVGKIIQRFEDRGYKLVAMKLVTAQESLVKEHYFDLQNKPFFAGLVKHLTSGPLVAMAWEGNGIISGARALSGGVNPADAPPGTIRGDFSVDVCRNVIHCSYNAQYAKREILLWFDNAEVG